MEDTELTSFAYKLHINKFIYRNRVSEVSRTFAPLFFNHKNETMKKIVFAISLLTFTATSFSQINKGQWLVGGSASLDFTKYGSDDDSKVTTFSLAPDAGYFFINNFAGGARVSFTSLKPKGEDASTSFLFAPFARYYFLPSSQKINVFADASYGFGSVKDGESDGMNQFAFAAGPAVFLSPNTALEFTLQYTSAGGDAYGDDRLNNFGLNVGFQVHLGK
jgi:hypothetical protein